MLGEGLAHLEPRIEWGRV